MNEVKQIHERESPLARDDSISQVFNLMSLSTFRVYITLYFLVLSVVFLLAFKVVYGIDLGQLTIEKQNIIQDEYYVMDLTQQQIFDDTNKYAYYPPYDCGGYTCEVHEYLAPPYTDNDRGYVMITKTDTEIIVNSTGKLKNEIDTIINLDTSTTTEIIK